MLACSYRFSLTTLVGLLAAALFEWCVQALPSGHVGPAATARNKRRLGKGLQKRRLWNGWSSPQKVEDQSILTHVVCPEMLGGRCLDAWRWVPRCLGGVLKCIKGGCRDALVQLAGI